MIAGVAMKCYNVNQVGNVYYNSFSIIFARDCIDLDIIENTDYGDFTKEELFWSIYERVLIPSHLYSYDSSPYDDKIHLFEIKDGESDEVFLFIEFVGVTDGYNQLKNLRQKTLNEATTDFYNLMVEIYPAETGETCPVKLDLSKDIDIPTSDEEIIRRLKITKYNC